MITLISLWVFWISLLLVASVFVFYPFFLLICRIIRKSGRTPVPVSEDVLPTVSIIVAARNAAALAAGKIENCFNLDYPPDKLEVVFGSDGSTDGTENIVSRISDARLKCRHFNEHQGKIAVLNTLVRQSRGDILLFSDVDALLEKDVLNIMVPYLADPAVGGVCGRRVIGRSNAALGKGQRSYIRFDTLIKILEDQNGCITANDGKLYAIRRELFAPIPDAVTDDLYVALGVIARGRRFRFAPGAVAVILPPAHSPMHEIRRRSRIVAQSLRGIFLMRRLLSVKRYRMVAVGLLINKIIRRLLPILMMAWGAAALFLWRRHFLYAMAAAAMIASVCIALSFPFLTAHINRFKPKTLNRAWRAKAVQAAATVSSLAVYFWLGNIGMMIGLFNFLTHNSVSRWEPEKGIRYLPDQSVAYIMSRFPKITETFILHEMTSVLEQGIAIAVYPLLKEHERVTHPEIRAIMPRVHYTPFLSAAVLGSNLVFLAQKPLSCLAVLNTLISGTLRHPKTLLKTMAIFPKSVHLARLAQRQHIGHIHAHFATYPATAAYIIHRLTAIPFSFTAHAHDIFMDRSLLTVKMKAAAFTVTISEFNKRLLARHVGSGCRIEIVRCGVNLSQFKPSIRQTGIGSAMELICVASYKDMKGHRYLLDACAILKEQGLAFTCHLIGEGPLRETIRHRIRQAGLSDRMIMHGPLPGPQVRRIMGTCDIAVLPSVVGERGDHDGIPVFLMEAMAMELPAVSTTLSGIPELIRDGYTGILVPPNDSAALARAILELSGNAALRNNMGKAGRCVVQSQFDMTKNNARLVQLFEESLAAAHSDAINGESAAQTGMHLTGAAARRNI